MKCKLIVVLAVLVANVAVCQRASANKEIFAVENGLLPYVPVDGFPTWNLESRMKYYGVPGVSIAVVNNYKVEWCRSYGLADTMSKKPVNDETVFSAGSISKFVLAVMALKLVEQGKLSLDSPINNYVRSWKLAENDFTRKTPVTLRMLLSHTGGTSQASYFGFTPDKNPLPSVLEIVSGQPIAESRPVVVNSEPGKEFRYSGGGSMVAQLALMEVTGKKFETLADELIFRPLGLSYSTFEQPLPMKLVKHASMAYSAAPWFKGMPYVYPQQAAAGLYTRPADLAKFLVDIQLSLNGQGNILSKKSAEILCSPQAEVSKGYFSEQIGVGPFLLQQADNDKRSGRYFEFTGVNAGFSAYLVGNVAKGYGAVIMLNSGDDFNGLGMEIRRSIARVYGWDGFLPSTLKPVTLSSTVLQEYEGRYLRGANEVVYIRKENDYLVERINEGRDIYCFPVAKDTIVFTDFNVKGYFSRDVNGRVNGLRTEWQDKPMRRMKDDEFTASELINAGRWEEAKRAYGQLNLNEYQLTYQVYEILNRRAPVLEAAKVILEVARDKFPNSAIVYSRWGDYYLKRGDKNMARTSFEKRVELDGGDDETRKKLEMLKLDNR